MWWMMLTSWSTGLARAAAPDEGCSVAGEVLAVQAMVAEGASPEALWAPLEGALACRGAGPTVALELFALRGPIEQAIEAQSPPERARRYLVLWELSQRVRRAQLLSHVVGIGFDAVVASQLEALLPALEPAQRRAVVDQARRRAAATPPLELSGEVEAFAEQAAASPWSEIPVPTSWCVASYAAGVQAVARALESDAGGEALRELAEASGGWTPSACAVNGVAKMAADHRDDVTGLRARVASW